MSDDVKKLLFDEPLYSRHEMEKGAMRQLIIRLRSFNVAVDFYCPECELSATFWGSPDEDFGRELALARAYGGAAGASGDDPYGFLDVDLDFEVRLSCARNPGHTPVFYFHQSLGKTRTLVKVGQHPSAVDFAMADLLKFKSVLDEPHLRELKRATELHAHGYNIGAFLHLRRIFEFLLDEAKALDMRERRVTDWPEYDRAAVVDRPRLLAKWLPNFLVENPKIYSHLSLGVHQLTEDQCGDDYGALRMSIDVILEERLEARARVERQRRTQHEIQKLNEQRAAESKKPPGPVS